MRHDPIDMPFRERETHHMTSPLLSRKRSVLTFLVLTALPFLLFVAPYIEMLVLRIAPERSCWLLEAGTSGHYFFTIEITCMILAAITVPLTIAGTVYIWLARLTLRASMWAGTTAGAVTGLFALMQYMTIEGVNDAYLDIYAETDCSAYAAALEETQ